MSRKRDGSSFARSHVGLAGVLLVAMVAAGCSRVPRRLALEGRVTVDGVPLESGAMAWIPTEQTGGPTCGGSITAGRFSIPAPEGARVGEYRVEITASRPGDRADPADQRQQRELRSEGIGALMRLVDVHRKCENLIDWQKVNDYAKKSGQKMPSYPVIKVFVDEVIQTALAEQDRVHREEDKKRQSEIAEAHAAIGKLKEKLAEAEEQYKKQVSLLREREQAELADRTNIRVIAQGEMLRTLEKVCLAAAKFVQQLNERPASGTANDQLSIVQLSAEAMIKEIESELRKAEVETDRDDQGMIRGITRRTPRDDNGSV